MILHLVFFIFAVTANAAPVTYADAPAEPTYETEINSVMALFNQNELAPDYVKTKFNEVVTEKRRLINEYGKYYRGKMNDRQRMDRAEFDQKMQLETKEWRKNNPKGEYRQFAKESSEKRKVFSDSLSKARKEFEESFRARQKQFDELVKIRRQEFEKKFADYKKAYAEKEKAKKESPKDSEALKEFKDIPKGPGSTLAPAKSE